MLENNKKNDENHIQIFDNPLAQKILTKADVAMLLRRSAEDKDIRWVERMTNQGRLIPHYVGDTAMFFLDEIVSAFLDGTLAQPRRPKTYERNAKKEQGRDDLLRSDSQISKRKKTLAQIRNFAGRT